MDIDLVERLMRLLETSRVTELDVSENGMRLRLSKGVSARAVTTGWPAAMQAAETETSAAAQSQSKPHLILSGLAGTFYRAPAPGEAPFVSVGDRVEEGQKLALVEAMKMMNPVEADRSGRIAAIHLDDAAPVSPGMALFSLEVDP